MPSLLFCCGLHADTILLKEGKDLKGLVVEEHEDRIILSTENGEVPVLRKDIQKVDYDSPAQNFMQVGRGYEEKQRLSEALGYYEKALELNPDLEEARKAAVRVRNQFWAKTAVGPVNEIEKRQSLYETWGRGTYSSKRKSDSTASSPAGIFQKNFGASLLKAGDWVQFSDVTPGKGAWLTGLRKHDRLVSVDGNSLRYLSVETVREKFLSPPGSSFTLEYDRELRLAKTGFEKEIQEFGLRLILDSRGVVVASVKPASLAFRAGLHENDVIVEVNGVSMRYLPIKKLVGVIQKDPSAREAVFTVRRSAMLMRR